MKQETINQALNALGFTIEESEDGSYQFDYEGERYVCCLADEKMLVVMLPHVVGRQHFQSKEELNEWTVLMNMSIRYVKAIRMDGEIALAVEHEIVGEEDMQEELQHIIDNIETARHFVWKIFSTDRGISY